MTRGQPSPPLPGAAGAVGTWVGSQVWEEGLWVGTLGGGTPMERCWLLREPGQQLLIHSWNGFSL